MKSGLIGLAMMSLWLVPGASQAESITAVAFVRDEAAFGESSARTLHNMFVDALRQSGVQVVIPPSFKAIQPSDEEIKKAATEASAQQIYLLTVSSLGQKLILRAELKGPDLSIVRVRNMNANRLEEADLVLPRLTRALVKDQSLEETASIDTLSQTEGRQWEKQPGEFLWGIGLLGGVSLDPVNAFAFGAEGTFAYEMKHFKLQADLGGIGADDANAISMFRLGIGASYLPFARDWSPYFGGRLNFLVLDAGDYSDQTGMGATVHAGLEFFRFHRARLLAEVGCTLPFFNVKSYEYNPNGQDKESSKWTPVGYASLGLQW